MPRGDRTGPMGMGLMTGRNAGFCAGFGMPGYANAGPRCGFGRGRAGDGYGTGGRGYRHRFYATGMPGRMRAGGYSVFSYPPPYPEVDPETEKQTLRYQAKSLQSELAQIEKRLAAIEKETAPE